MDVQELFETEIGRGPVETPLVDRIEAGRSALRRRRLTAAGSSAAAVVAVVAVLGIAGNTFGDLRSDRDGAPANNSPSADRAFEPAPPDEELTDATPVGSWDECKPGPFPPPEEREHEPIYCADDQVQFRNGDFKRREGAAVSQRLDDPYVGEGVESSAAIETTYEGRTQWTYHATGENGALSATFPAEDFEPGEAPTLAEWAAETGQSHAAEKRRPEYKDADGTTWPGLVSWRDGDWMIHPNVTVIDRIDNPVDDRFASIAVVAEVDGTVWWQVEAIPSNTTYIQAAGAGDFEDWVAEHANQSEDFNMYELSFDENGKVVGGGSFGKVVDQITSPDLDWFGESGEQTALVAIRSTTPPEWTNFVLVRTRDGVVEVHSTGSVGPKDTLQTVLARLQEGASGTSVRVP